MLELREISIEVEALWGICSVEPIENLIDHGWELKFAIQEHLSEIESAGIRESSKKSKLFREIGSSGQDTSEFSQLLNDCIDEVENIAKAKL